MTEKNLDQLLRNMAPELNAGEYVFVTSNTIDKISRYDTLCEFKEKEGTTIVMEKTKADALQLSYNFIAAWITLTVRSSLNAVGLTALFSTELAKYNISCNVIAGYYHDHIFVDTKDAKNAIGVLKALRESHT